MGFLDDVGSGFKDIYNGLTGNPSAVKAAYDKQIQASKENAAQMQHFLLGREAQAQGIYGPLQHMFTSAYGSEGLQAPEIPGGTAGMTPLASMYGSEPGGAPPPSPAASGPAGAQHMNFRRTGAK